MHRPLTVSILALAISVSGSPLSTLASGPAAGPNRSAAQAATWRPGPVNRAVPLTRETPSPSRPLRELAQKRTRTSMTYVGDEGYETRVYSGPINFRDASGSWHPIDNTLIPTAGTGYQNKANDYRIHLPADLGQGPIEVSLANGGLAISMVGASGRGTVSGSTDTFANALPGVDAAYTVGNALLKESLTLKSPSAAHSFVYRIRASTGLLARETAGGGVDFVNRAGVAVLSLAAPFMYDSSHTTAGFSRAVTLRLGGVGAAQSVTLSADPAWLTNPARQWPVVIDPTIGPSQDCYLKNGGSADTSFCGGQSLLVGYDGSLVSRSLLQFDVQSAIGSQANVMEARLAMNLTSAQSSSAVAVELHQLTQTWTTAATWNRDNGVNAWTLPGGTYASGSTWTNSSVGPTTGWYYWYLSRLAEGWARGSIPNDGLLLRASSESSANLLQFASAEATNSSLWPYLKIDYEPWLGEQSWWKYESHRLTDRMHLLVNMASGNLVLHADDLSIRGTGINEDLYRSYNSLSPDAWNLGNNWYLNTGYHVSLDMDDGDGPTLFGIRFMAHFIQNPDGSFTPPSGLDATLINTGPGAYALTINKTQEKLTFVVCNGCIDATLRTDQDRNGNQLAFTYGGNGVLSSISDSQGRVTTFGYTSSVNSGYITTITDPAGRQLQYAYDSNSNLTSYTDAAGKVTTYAYDGAGGHLLQITDPNANVTKFTYDGGGRVTAITYVMASAPNGGYSTSFSYNSGVGSCNNVGSVVNGIVGNTVVTDANSHVTTHCYDNQGRVIKALDAKNQAAATSYTSDNNVQTYSDAANPSSPTSFTYDPTTNNLTKAAEPTGANQTWAYQQNSPNDPRYAPDSYTDAQGNKNTYTYDGNTNLTSASNSGSGATWTATYNGNGTVATNKDANGNLTSYTYDGVGNLTKITYPAPLGAVNMTYDSLSRMLTRTDGKGQLTQYAYDVMDRLTQLTYADSSTIVYTYDNDGNTTQLQDNTGITNFTYDNLNRQTKKVLPDTTTMNYGYDAVSNLASLQDPGGSVTYAYDQVNELSSLTEPNGGITNFSYNAGYRRTSTAYPNGVTENMSYDSSERLTQIKATKGASTLNSFSYCYNRLNPCSTNKADDTDLRWSVTDVNNATSSYSYNALNRLVGASGAGGSYTYGYDANGNLTNNNGASQAFNAANELTSSGSTTYSFDANGNETGNNVGLSLTYNAKDHTTGITAPGQAALNMTYSGATQTERVTAGATSFTYNVLGCGGASTGVGGNTPYTRDNKGQLVEERVPGIPNYTPYYYLFDGLGSVVGLTDGVGTVVDTYSYEPYGKIRTSTGTVVNPWLFASGYLDVQTGFYKFGMRYYDPTVARWSQEDPQAGPNLYTYAGDDPINNIDPSGAACNNLLVEAAGIALVGAAIGLLAASIAVGWIAAPVILGVELTAGGLGWATAGFGFASAFIGGWGLFAPGCG